MSYFENTFFYSLTSLLLKDIRIQQRNGRKTLTTVQGLPSEYDQKKLLKAFKKVRIDKNKIMLLALN